MNNLRVGMFRPILRMALYLWWPVPLWKLRGYAVVQFSGHTLKLTARRRITRSWINWIKACNRGLWERGPGSAFARQVRPGDVVVDIGAFEGLYALLAANLVGPSGKVWAFEPDDVARQLLIRNLRLNGISNVEVLPYAISDSTGDAWLRIDHLGGSATRLSHQPTAIRTQTVTLDEFCETNNANPDIIKIDVEGAEVRVFGGGSRVLTQARAILLEYHHRRIRHYGVDASGFYQSLFELDKRLYIVGQRGGDGSSIHSELSRESQVEVDTHILLLKSDASNLGLRTAAEPA